MSKNLSLTVLGGGQEIGANSYLLDFGGRGVLLDSGMHPKRQGLEALPNFGAVQSEVTNIFITHAHLDHVGSLPVAIKNFPRARAYMTNPTAMLAVRLLRNALAVARSRSQGRLPPLYTGDQVDWIENVLCTLRFKQPLALEKINGTAPQVTFYNAGHLLGAAGILLEYEGQRIFYTGDTSASRQWICCPADYPTGPIDVLILDSTHGADHEPNLSRDEQNFVTASEELGRFIQEVTARGGSVLIPVFAMGRCQEILGVLQSLKKTGAISSELPVFISGLARSVCRIYDNLREQSERLNSDFVLEDTRYQLLETQQLEQPDLLERPAIYAITSGMMYEGTSSHTLACKMVGDDRHGVAFVGFLDPDSPGYRLSMAAPGQQVDLGRKANAIKVAATVRHFNFTSHSRLSQTIKTVQQLKPRRVLLVHGDEEATKLQAASLNELGFSTTLGEAGKTYIL